MAAFRRFEDIHAWQKGRTLTTTIFQLAQESELKKNFALKDQIIRCTISITANIAEGFERNSNKEFSYFLAIAKGSTGELRSFLYVLLDNRYIEQSQFDEIYQLTQEVSAMLSKLITYLSKSPLKGTRYRTLNIKP